MKSKKGLFIAVVAVLVAVVIALVAVLAVVNKWNVAEWFTSPLAIVLYALIACGAITLGSFVIMGRITHK